MPSTKNLIRYVLALTVVLLLAGLGGWYYFLNKQGQAITATDTGRGLASSPPSFGNTTGSTYSNVSGAGTSGTSQTQIKAPPRLWHVTKTPVAGMGFVDMVRGVATSTAATSSSQLYFAERGTGYILKADSLTGSLTRLTNKLFLHVYEAVFDSFGDVVLRSLDDGGNILSFAGRTPGQNATTSPSSTGTATALSGNYLGRNIRAIVPNPQTHGLLLLVPGTSGGADVVLSSWDGATQKTIFSSPLSGWKLFSLSDGRIFLSPLPSDDTAGYAFQIQNGTLIPRLRDIPGLTFLPRASSDVVLFGQSSGGDVSLLTSLKKDSGVSSLPIRTVADKCVWAPPPLLPSGKKTQAAGSGPLIAYCAVPDNFASKNFLADWYMGAVHTSDSWWRVDASTGQVTPVLQPGDTGETFDVENPVIDNTGTMISFMDATDKSLWLLRIQQ